MEPAYRRVRREDAPENDWLLALTDEQRGFFRGRGQAVADTLLAYLDAVDTPAAQGHLEAAEAAAEEQGAAAAALGLSLSRTVETFLRFREPFHHVLASTARRRGFDAAETTDLLQAAERAMDRLLIATMRGHGDPVRA